MNRTLAVVVTVVAASLLAGSAGAGELEFDGRTWEVTGPVSVDTEKAPEGVEAGSLKVEPGGKAVLKLRDEDGSGTVEFSVWESGAVIEKPKSRATGPLYGVRQSDGRMLAPGSIYAPYLSGHTTYSLTAYNPKAQPAEQPSWKVAYLGIKRTEGWHKWTFVFDPEKGCTVKHNGKDVNARRERFDWNKFKVEGFNAVIVVGDGTKEANQTVWLSGLDVEPGGPMKVKPTPPPPPPPATPEKDPAPEDPAPLVESLRGKHPRLLFGAEDIDGMKAFIATPRGKAIWEEVLKYLPPSRKPDHTKFLRDGTDAQRQGFWRLPSVALHYVLTGDRKSFDRTVEFMKFLMELKHWEEGKETDSGMGAANIMIGAALAYDWLYDDLEPEFRSQYRDKLLLQARRMYHRGHLGKGGSGGYWTNDPQNNHRWHRNAGLALCALAAAEEDKTDDDWILAKLKDELAFVARWLPDDGTSHESPTYMIFGASHLLLGMTAGDRCFGTENLQKPFFENANRFMTQTLAPGLTHRFAFGDQGGVDLGPVGYGVFQLKTAGVHDLEDHLAVLDRRIDDDGVARRGLVSEASGRRHHGKHPGPRLLPRPGTPVRPRGLGRRRRGGDVQVRAVRRVPAEQVPRPGGVLRERGPRRPGRELVHALRGREVPGRDRPVLEAQAVVEPQHDPRERHRAVVPRPPAERRMEPAGHRKPGHARHGRHHREGRPWPQPRRRGRGRRVVPVEHPRRETAGPGPVPPDVRLGRGQVPARARRHPGSRGRGHYLADAGPATGEGRGGGAPVRSEER